MNMKLAKNCVGVTDFAHLVTQRDIVTSAETHTEQDTNWS